MLTYAHRNETRISEHMTWNDFRGDTPQDSRQNHLPIIARPSDITKSLRIQPICVEHTQLQLHVRRRRLRSASVEARLSTKTVSAGRALGEHRSPGVLAAAAALLVPPPAAPGVVALNRA